MAGVSKITIATENGDRVLVDLTGDNVTADSLVTGYTAHGADGEVVEGANPYELEPTNMEVGTQTSLIAQISAALEGKASGGGVGKPEQEKIVAEDITTNGAHTFYPDDGYTMSKVTVNVNVPDVPAVVEELNVTENGTYEPDDGVDGFSKVTVNVASSGGGDTGLPAGYRRVDYIQFTGEQLVDTGIIGTQDTQINASFTWESSTQRHLFGCTSSDNTASVTSYMNGSWRFGNKSQTKQVSSKNEKLPYSCLINKTTISLNSSVTAISGLNDFETVGTLLLGGARDADGTLPSAGITGKVFYFILWSGDEQVQKLVPVVSADGVYRFFDLVTKNFFDSITGTPLGGGNL